jgi:hypothetical protein
MTAFDPSRNIRIALESWRVDRHILLQKSFLRHVENQHARNAPRAFGDGDPPPTNNLGAVFSHGAGRPADPLDVMPVRRLHARRHAIGVALVGREQFENGDSYLPL